MGKIKKETYQRICTLYAVSRFSDGVYGRTRLQKTLYEATKKSPVKPFQYTYYEYGQFSFDVVNTYEQLLSMGYIIASPLDSKTDRDGNKLSIKPVFNTDILQKKLRKVLGANLQHSVDHAVKAVGYRPTSLLLKQMYEELKRLQVKKYDLLFEDNLEDEVELKGIGPDECESLDLAFNPDFVAAMDRMCLLLPTANFDAKKVKRVHSIGRSI